MTLSTQPVSELVVLLDEDGGALGTAPKDGVHGVDTPTHLAFSLYVVDPDDRLLVTRRARDKLTFPGLVTNSVCGHPGPDEPLRAAAARRAGAELGLQLDPARIRLLLPAFRYRAEMDGIVENERCPVLLAQPGREPDLRPDPAEVDEAWWMPWADYRDAVLSGELAVSPWSREQVAELATLGSGPARWPAGDPALLPSAARW